MNKISRKGFLKIAAAAAMSGVTAGALAACNAASSSTAASSAAISCHKATSDGLFFTRQAMAKTVNSGQAVLISDDNSICIILLLIR